MHDHRLVGRETSINKLLMGLKRLGKKMGTPKHLEHLEDTNGSR